MMEHQGSRMLLKTQQSLPWNNKGRLYAKNTKIRGGGCLEENETKERS